ncbi:MAG: hypothetical protein A2Z95_04375 [Gallionellales bacterium GWA2_60_18]|nr:MAG: hypothetical protein A2Z95_04375 [Gallionellales bacterium GWA2_60_18]
MADLQESAQLNELYRLYGIAAHNCSNIEYRIVYLLLGPKWKQTANLNSEIVVEIYDKLQRLPLGVLLKEYKQHFIFSDKQRELMDSVLEKRNYLMHRFFGAYGKKMHDPRVQEQMISELKDLTSIFQSVSRSLDPETWKQA